ncbi:MAG: 3-deoxy-7-phosphoheptulonate synthase [bacterium]
MNNTNLLPTFNTLKTILPLTAELASFVKVSTEEIKNILAGKSDKILLLTGPCSIHNYSEAIKIAEELVKIQTQFPQYFIAMRVCCDKPRTKKDWEGYFNDPDLDGTCDIAKGLTESRRLILDILKLGLPVACEVLNPLSHFAIADLYSYTWIGARTATAPFLRNYASGLNTPIGVKNSNEGDSFVSAINAIDYITHPSIYSGVNEEGQLAKIETVGNKLGHLILRGNKSGPNYSEEFVTSAVNELTTRNLPTRLVIDCSHGNCEGDYKKQISVFDNVIIRIKNGEKNIAGLMLEVYLQDGKQDSKCRLGTPQALQCLLPNTSATDACISIEQLVQTLTKTV